MSLQTWLRALVGTSQGQRKVPVLGVEGSGKSSFFVSLAQYVSANRYGSIDDLGQGYLGELVEHVARGQPIPPTMRYEQIKVHLRRVPEPGGGFRDVNVLLSSEDVPGGHFRDLVAEIRRDPGLSANSPMLTRFGELLRASDGFLFVVDVVRGASAEAFHADPDAHYGRAFAEQIGPIATGLLLAARRNPDLARKPTFFVFSKRDVHGRDRDELDAAFHSYLAIPLANLERKGANIRRYDVQSACWPMRGRLGDLGYDELLSDLAHALDVLGR